MEIFVKNIPFTAKPEDLRELFAPYGAVGRVNLITDRETGRPRGFGFVEMPNTSEAQAAIAALQNVKMQGRQLTVNAAWQRELRRESRLER
jgi:cold-inducible RNA-binding protein